MFKRATAFYYIIERRNEIDLKNTGMGREIENILTKKEKNSSLKFTRFDFYQNRANIRPKGEREFPIDLRRSFAFDRHSFTSLCKMFRATSTLNDKRHSKFSPFFFFVLECNDNSQQKWKFQWRRSSILFPIDLTKWKQKFLFYNYSLFYKTRLFMLR